MEAIKIAIVGIGNCASSLVQGIEYYEHKRPEEAVGLMHWEIGGYRPSDIEVVAAFDIDIRKVGKAAESWKVIWLTLWDEEQGRLVGFRHLECLGGDESP